MPATAEPFLRGKTRSLPMIRRIPFSFRLRALGLAALAVFLAGTATTQADEADTPAALFQGSAADFQKLDAAKEEIDPKNLREALLSAAIFHETNERRAGLKLPALAFHEKAGSAAVAHAVAMAKHRTLSHGTPWKEPGSTAYERLVAQGLQPRFSAENIAFNFVLRYEAGKPFYQREENGGTVYSYEPDGAPLKPHTYLSFAEAILTQWMNSPGHRKNIIAPESEFLGVGCALSNDDKGFDTIYADQDFFAPLPAAPVP